jgi:hypothetical protein
MEITFKQTETCTKKEVSNKRTDAKDKEHWQKGKYTRRKGTKWRT